MEKNFLLLACLFISIFAVSRLNLNVLAEQSGSSPESGSDSRIKEAYDWLIGKGDNYGTTDAADWTTDWGSYWNRIMEAAAWEPDGTATAAEIPMNLTFYAGGGDRTQKTGTLYSTWHLQDYDDSNCAGNNGEATNTCGAGDSEYTGEEGTWTLKASGGTSVSVTDNSITVTLASNKVYMDNRTQLFWTDTSAQTVDNEFVYIDGQDRANPSGNSCNFNAAGVANGYCDNQDPLNGYVEDNDVSAAEFCLNLALDSDNADSDDNGTTGTETDWRLPTQKELLQAYINGSNNNLPNTANYFWSSTEAFSTQSNAWYVHLGYANTSSPTKNTGVVVRCVRRD